MYEWCNLLVDRPVNLDFQAGLAKDLMACTPKYVNLSKKNPFTYARQVLEMTSHKPNLALVSDGTTAEDRRFL